MGVWRKKVSGFLYIIDELRRWNNWLEWNKGGVMDVDDIEQLSKFLRQLADAGQAQVEAANKLAGELYDALHSEYVSCPMCGGHIGSGDDHHEVYCALLPIAIANGHVAGPEQWEHGTSGWAAARVEEE
jgi:hypothetical protein